LDGGGDGRVGSDQRLLGAAHLALARPPAASGAAVKLSRDAEFVPKLRDIVGLYIDPPAPAMVLSVDEKSHVWMAPGSQGKRLC
jgi:hypothetical protein